MSAKLSCAICQPHYLPWMGYFEMIDRVDEFVFLDDVQFIKREWKNRNKIRKTAQSAETKWLTVPIAGDCQMNTIKDARISQDTEWQSEHLNGMKSVYESTPFFDEYYGGIAQIIEKFKNGSLADLNISLVAHLCGIFGIKTKMHRSSDLNTTGKREEKLLNICKALKSDFYLANNATAEYVGAEYFAKDGIGFAPQNYTHPVYGQTCKNKQLTFISHLSIVDLLFNHGGKSMDIIRTGRPA